MMTGLFELFTDFRSRTRFRLLAADGLMLAVSQAYPGTAPAAKAITHVRECAGTGLIQDHSADPPAPVGLPRPYRHSTPTARNRSRAFSAPGRPAVYADIRPPDLILVRDEVEQFLDAMATFAEEWLSAAGTEVSCGITVRQRTKPVALAGIEGGARSLEALGNILGERPSLAAGLADVLTWPRFVQSAVRHGLGSVLSVPVSGQGGARAALTCYAKRPNAFSPQTSTPSKLSRFMLHGPSVWHWIQAPLPPWQGT